MFRAIRDWVRYERLAHYPALAAFDRESALKRLRKYEREERAAIWPWPWVVLGGLTLVWSAVMVLAYAQRVSVFVAASANLLGIVSGWFVRYGIHLRLKRRVNAKIAGEFDDGRLRTCVECGYDVRVAEECCSECGASIRVEPTA